MKDNKTIIEEFNKNFFIGGINAHGIEKPLLFPAKHEVAEFIEQALKTVEERERERMIKSLKTPAQWEKSFKMMFDGKECCSMCGFSYGKLIETLTTKDNE